MVKTLLGLDYGQKFCGLATGNTLTRTAQPLTTLAIPSAGAFPWEALLKILADWLPDQIIVGNPLNMDGSSSITSQRCLEFSRALQKKTPIPVLTMDERLSTREARDRLKKYYPANKQQDRLLLNSIAAQIILETWIQNNLS